NLERENSSKRGKEGCSVAAMFQLLAGSEFLCRLHQLHSRTQLRVRRVSGFLCTGRLPASYLSWPPRLDWHPVLLLNPVSVPFWDYVEATEWNYSQIWGEIVYIAP